MSQIVDPRLGTTIAGYRLDAVIGRGGMGVVYLAEHLRLQRRVALKLLAPELVDRPGFRERFIRESRLAASIDHPNILPIYDADEVGEVLYIAMRYVEGTDLKRLIEGHGRLEPAAAVRIVSQVAGALEAAHGHGLVHRDVKPGNVLIASGSGSGEERHVYLSDFGLTKQTSSDSGITATGQFVGTLDYAAPEQFEGKPLDARTDEYSLGCVLFECLTGAPPYVRENDAAVMYAHLMAPVPSMLDVRADLPPDLDAATTKAMAKAPDDRYPSAGTFATAARSAIGVSQEGAVPVRPGPTDGGSRRRVGLVVGAVLLAIGLIGAAIAFLPRGGDHPSATHSSAGSAPPAAGQLVEIDPVSGTVAGTFDVGPSATGVAIGEAAVWVLDPKDEQVVRVDPSNGRVVARVAVGKDPNAIAVGEGGVWVCTSAGIVERIDPATNAVAATVRVSLNAQVIAAGDGAVLLGEREFTQRIDPHTNEVTSVKGPAGGLGLTSGDGKLWFVSEGSGGFGGNITIKPELYRFDPAANRGVYVGTFIETNSGYSMLPLAVGHGTAWEPVIGTSNQIIPLDTTTGKPGTIIRVGAYPVGLALDGIGGLWVLNQGDGTAWKISTESHQAVAVVPVGQRAMGIAADSHGVWVTVQSLAAPSP